jgi:hypothetical protein
MLEEASKDEDKEEYHWKRFLRLWGLMEALLEHGSVPRIDLVHSLFTDCYSELDHYEEEAIVCYRQLASPLKPQPHQLLEPERASTQPTATATPANPAELRSPIEVTQETRKSDLENVLVTPGSDRVLAAFKRIISDPRMQELKSSVQLKIKKGKLKSEKKDVKEELDALASLRRDLVREHEVIIQNYPQYSTLLGQARAMEMVTRSLELHTKATERWEKLTLQYEELENKLDAL